MTILATHPGTPVPLTDLPGQRQPVTVGMPIPLERRLVATAQRLNAVGLKGFGLLLGDPESAGHPFEAVDAIFLDARANRRNDPGHREAFHAQGSYFRAYDDAGFVADPRDLLAAFRDVEARGLEVVAPFHVHRRQPANFSVIDYRLHNPEFGWHLVISLADRRRPDVRAFRVRKPPADFGIADTDGLEGSHLPYPGREVQPLPLDLC